MLFMFQLNTKNEDLLKTRVLVRSQSMTTKLEKTPKQNIIEKVMKYIYNII